jgi:saccharopepsin
LILFLGTSLIAVPKSVSDEIHSKMFSIPFINGMHIIKCDKANDLIVTMSGKQFVLDKADFTIPLFWGFCISTVIGMDLPKEIIILGDTFLRKYYSIYDMQNHRVGLALST